jgi:hypothetical protein
VYDVIIAAAAFHPALTLLLPPPTETAPAVSTLCAQLVWLRRYHTDRRHILSFHHQLKYSIEDEPPVWFAAGCELNRSCQLGGGQAFQPRNLGLWNATVWSTPPPPPDPLG